MSGTALATAGPATDLIPGDPQALDTLAAGLDAFSTELAGAADIVLAAQAATSWVGVAADTFAAAQKEQPDKLTRAADAFHHAAQSLRTYAGVLAQAQATAGRALAAYQDAQHTTQLWQTINTLNAGKATASQPAPPVTPDPGADGRASAQAQLNGAQHALDEAALAVTAALGAAASEAPSKPGIFSRAWSDASGAAGDAWDGVSSAGQWAWQHGGQQITNTMEYALTHPQEGLHLLGDTGLMALGALGLAATGVDEAAGVALDATGVGAFVGVPLNIAGAALATVSVGAIAAGGLDGAQNLSRMNSEANAEDSTPEPAPPSGSDGGPGEWKAVNRGPDKAPWRYQRQVNGTPLGPNGEQYEYEVNGVKFDGYDAGPPPTLLDAKGAYQKLLNSDYAGRTVRTDFLNEAGRQLEAAGGHDITWVCAEPETAAKVTQLFDENGLGGLIKVVVETPK